MVLVFGKKTCANCLKKKIELQAKGTEFKYYDLETAEGMAKAASLDLLSENRDLPIIVDIDK
jgi:glutaredoxin